MGSVYKDNPSLHRRKIFSTEHVRCRRKDVRPAVAAGQQQLKNHSPIVNARMQIQERVARDCQRKIHCFAMNIRTVQGLL
jgi:hypothetical protein